MSAHRFFRLSQIIARISEILAPHTQKLFWVKAEISGLSSGRGNHYFFDLIETSSTGSIIAKIRCVLWSSDYLRISSRFKKENIEFQLKNGTTVGVECSLDFQATEGLRLKIHDSDVEFALGELELKKRRLIKMLKDEGEDARNKALPLPMLPLRLGLITSKGSAAFQDIVKTLTESEAGFEIFVADSVMQGEQAQASILKALNALESIDLQVVIIARGGGSKTDLSYLDNEAIARKIAGLRLPVWTAIGHEIDFGALDVVANQSFKTPTASAEELAGRFARERGRIREAIRLLHREWGHRWKREDEFLERSLTGVRQGTRKLADVTGEALDIRMINFRRYFELTMINRKSCLRAAIQGIQKRTDAVLTSVRDTLVAGKARLGSSPIAVIRNSFMKCAQMKERLNYARIQRRLISERGENDRSKISLMNGYGRRIKDELKANEQMEPRIRAYDPRNALRRGYAIIRGEHGKIVRSLHSLSPPADVLIEMGDGTAEGTITKIEATE